MNILDYFNSPSENPSLVHSGFEEFTCPNDLLADSDTIVRAFTVTLHPRNHGVNPKLMNRKFKNDIIDLFHRARKDIYIETHSELTKNFIIHWHCVIYTKSKFYISKLFAHLRKHYGFILQKEPRFLEGWLEYCNKENLFKPFKFRVK